MSVQLHCFLLVFVLCNLINNVKSYQNSACERNQFTCSDKSCIPQSARCDGKIDCHDGSDENNCMNNCQPPHWFKCENHQCISSDLECNEEYNCLDLSDERNCTHKEKITSCRHSEFFCNGDNICIPEAWLCNGIKECSNGEDESYCHKLTCHEEHKCNSGECIQKDWICDGVSDCRDNSDEIECSNRTKPEHCTSDRGLVLCGDKRSCIPLEEVCDGIHNCPDKSDEIFCAASRNCVKMQSDKRNGTWCGCPPGHHLTESFTCKDIDECSFYGFCDQKCTNTKGNYSCSCIEGYVLQSDKKTCEVSSGDVNLFYTDRHSIKGLLLKSNVTFTLINNLSDAMGVAFYDGHVYYIDMVGDDATISSAYEEGSNRQQMFTIGLKKPESIAIDYITSNLYFTDTDLKHIAVCSTIKVYCKIILKYLYNHPHGLALNPMEGVMFWTEWGHVSKIGRASMDGRKAEDFITEDLHSPIGIAVDVISERLFWVDSFRKVIESVKFDKTDRRIIYKATLQQPQSLAVFENRVYWSDLSTYTIESCEKFDGKNHQILVKYVQNSLNSIAVYHPVMQESRTNPCANVSCSELCLLNYLGSHSCECSEGKKLDPFGLECMEELETQFILGTETSLWMMDHKIFGKVNATKLPFNFDSISALAYNSMDNTIFVADKIKESILKVNLHSRQVDKVLLHIEHILAMDFDHLGRNLLWCNFNGSIELFSSQSKARKIIATLPSDEKPVSIALVPESGYIFLSVQKMVRAAEIKYFFMDGSSTSMTSIRDGLTGPVYLTFDGFSNKIFWADSSTGTIENYDVVYKFKNVYERSQYSISGIAALKDNLFWIKQKSNKLFWTRHEQDSKFNHTINHYAIEKINSTEDIKQLVLISPRVLSIDHPCGHNNGNCSHLCLSGKSLSAKCICPFGMKLKEDGKTCFDSMECTEHEFLCKDSELCIPKEQRCNHHKDCIHGEDEIDCPKEVICSKDYFQCHNGDCIDKSLVCDLNFDCRDKSDEAHCDEFILGNVCHHTEFRCLDGSCITASKYCDGSIDCHHGEDEDNCPVCSSEHHFKCNIGTCIPIHWECDGEPDCPDNSDEHLNCEYKNCKPPDFYCKEAKICIEEKLVCNHVNDCGDDSDELECGKNYTNNCKHSEYSCYKTKSMCIPIEGRCNDTVECPNFEDEEDCPSCLLHEFMCEDKKCILSRGVCDGFPDCDDKSDESRALCSHTNSRFDTETIITCSDNMFTCNNGQCIDNKLVCNNEINCQDGSDEGGKCTTSCKEMNCDACMKTPQGPKCMCKKGYQLSLNGLTCVDIEECKQEPPVCSQKCIEMMGGYKCQCYENFQLRSDGVTCKNKDERLSYVFLSHNIIFRISDNEKLNEVFSGNSITNVKNFDISVGNSFIYFIVEDAGQLHRINFNTSEHIYMSEFGRLQLIAVEWISELVYMVADNVINQSIYVCSFETSFCSIIHSVVGENLKITALTVDAINRKLFFATAVMDSSPKSKIFKCNLDGSYVEEIHLSNDDYVTSMACDFYKKHLYFLDKNDGMIFRINYLGEDQRTIMPNCASCSDLKIYEGYLYFLNSNHKLQTCQLFENYNACTKRILHDRDIVNFAMNYSSLPANVQESKCHTKPCRNLCIPVDNTDKCICELSESKHDRPEECRKTQLKIYDEFIAISKAQSEENSIPVWAIAIGFFFLLVVIIVAYLVFRYYPHINLPDIPRNHQNDNDSQLRRVLN